MMKIKNLLIGIVGVFCVFSAVSAFAAPTETLTRYRAASKLASILTRSEINQANEQDLETLKKLIVEFQHELDARGVKIVDQRLIELVSADIQPEAAPQDPFIELPSEHWAYEAFERLGFPADPVAVNTPITLDLRDTDLRDVFRMLGMHVKKNIIVHDSITPTQLVSTRVENVPLSAVFSYFFKTYNIDYLLIGKDTVLFGTREGLSDKETMGRLVHNGPITFLAPTETLTRHKAASRVAFVLLTADCQKLSEQDLHTLKKTECGIPERT